MCLLLSRFCFCPFSSFDVYLSVLVSLIRAHTESHPPSSFVFVLLCLVSIRSQRVKGWGPLIPLGTTGGSEYTQGSSQRGLPIALCTSDCRHFLAFRDMRSDVQYVVGHTNNNRRMCALRYTRLRCASLFMLAAAVMLLLCFPVCLLLYISGKGLQVHIEPAAHWTTLPMCLCVVAESQSGMSF